MGNTTALALVCLKIGDLIMILSVAQASKREKVTKLPQIPKYHCASCKKQCDGWCSFFNRHVVLDYNKCFNHSFYNQLTKYVEPPRLKEIVMEEYEEELRKQIA